MEVSWGIRGRYCPISFINVTPQLFSGITSESHAHFKQTAAGFTWKAPEATALAPSLIGTFLPPQMSQKKKKMLQPDSHAVNKGWSESACCTFSSFFLSYLLNAVSLTPSVSNPPPLSSSGSVPTVPPGNVQGESVNSTTVRFTWSAPSPQFINGINQGYKVRGPFLSTGAL